MLTFFSALFVGSAQTFIKNKNYGPNPFFKKKNDNETMCIIDKDEHVQQEYINYFLFNKVRWF